MADYYYAKLVYNAAGGSGAPTNTVGMSQTPGASMTLRVASAVPSRQYYTFKGWAFSSGQSSGMSGGTALSVNASTTAGSSNARVYNLYAAWQPETAVLSYNANGGSGAPNAQTVNKNEWFALRTGVPTRSGYEFVGWNTSSTATAATYQPGGQARIVSNMTLYAVWKVSNSTISSITSSVPIDGSTQGSVSISSINNSYTHQLTLSIGESSQVISLAASVTSATFTIPSSWLSEVPNSTTGTAVASLKTFNGSTQIGGTDVKTFSITVPANIVPVITVATDYVNSNATVDGWDILLQNYSQIKLTATASGGTGATVATFTFTGDGLSQTSASNEATSSVLTSSGSRSWTVTVTDSRGRTASTIVTDTVHEYFSPSIASLTAFRSDSAGNRDDAAGTYINATGVFSFASADGNNTLSVDAIEYMAEDGTSWTVGQSPAVSGNSYTFGGGLIKETKMFHVRLSLTDALGNSAQYVVDVAPIVGYGFGLKNDRVHFGGPCKEPGFVCDFPTKLVNGHVVGSHSAAGNYAKVLTFELLGSNVTAPITVEFIRTGDSRPTEITFCFGGGSTLTSFTSNNVTDAYLHYDSSIWTLYIGKSNSSDSIEILDFHNPWSNSDISVEWQDDSISTLPTGYVEATGIVRATPSATSIASGAWKTVAQIELTPGIWLINCRVQFPSNTTGRRVIALASSTDSGSDIGYLARDSQTPVNGEGTIAQITDLRTVTTTTTYYLNAFQNSGSAQSVTARIAFIQLS